LNIEKDEAKKTLGPCGKELEYNQDMLAVKRDVPIFPFVRIIADPSNLDNSLSANGRSTAARRADQCASKI
jgi:hypothetical protein